VDVLSEPWDFVGPFRKMTFASRMQHLIYWGPLKKPLEWSLKTVLAPWSYLASVLYHDTFWYPTHQKTVASILGSEWGRLFQNWDQLAMPPDDLITPGWKDVGQHPVELKRQSMKYLKESFRILGTCLKEAPEFRARRRFKGAVAGS
jgi:hypothetical protein